MHFSRPFSFGCRGGRGVAIPVHGPCRCTGTATPRLSSFPISRPCCWRRGHEARRLGAEGEGACRPGGAGRAPAGNGSRFLAAPTGHAPPRPGRLNPTPGHGLQTRTCVRPCRSSSRNPVHFTDTGLGDRRALLLRGGQGTARKPCTRNRPPRSRIHADPMPGRSRRHR